MIVVRCLENGFADIENTALVFHPYVKGPIETSGMIDTISLPAPKLNINNLEIPNTTKYEIDAFFEDLEKALNPEQQ